MKKASEILNTIMDKLLSENEFPGIFLSWHEILGEKYQDIAEHSEAVDIKNNVLFVYVDHPGWAQKIELSKGNILQRIQAHYPYIQNIFIQKVTNEKLIERREQRVLGKVK